MKEWQSMKKTAIFIFSFLLLGFTVYIALDTFVIKRVYRVVKKENVESVTEPVQEDDSPIITDNIYKDKNISIELTGYREYNTEIYVANIRISSIEYLKTMFAQNTYGKNIRAKTSEMAEEAGAILAVNGDYYGSREKGYVIRDGVLYRSQRASKQYDLVINYDGSFEIIYEKDITAEELIEKGAKDVFSFGPGLLIHGEIQVSENDEVDQSMASNPRTAIGQIAEGHYVMIVSDGRTDESEGLSLYELAGFMNNLGVQTAYNLDGGGSSTMYFNGNIINNPVNHGSTIGERKVSDIIYIGY